MSGSWFQESRGARRRIVEGALLALLVVPVPGVAESRVGSDKVTSHLNFRVVIPPVFRVLQVTPSKDGYEYRVWTNTPSIVLNGREFRFNRLGENSFRLPAPPAELFVVHGL